MRQQPGIKEWVQAPYVFKIPAYFVLGWQECETNEKLRVWTKPDMGQEQVARQEQDKAWETMAQLLPFSFCIP